MATIQAKGNKNSNRNNNNNNNNNSVTRRKKKSSRRRTEDTALGIRSERSSSSSEDEEEGEDPVRTLLSDTLGDSRSETPGPREKSSVTGNRNLNSNLNESRQPTERRISRRDIVALLDEQRSFREELEDISKTNFNLEHLLSNCALKVENFNRKLLLVEYELSDFNSSDFSNPDQLEMKWKESKEKTEEKGCAEEEDLPRSVPLRRSNKSMASPSTSPCFDDGRHKLEKYAKIHGIVDVEIEMYSSADDFETTTDNRETTDLEEDLKANSDSENTFSYGDKDETNESNGDVLEKTSDVTKEIVTSTGKPFRFSTRDELAESKDTFKIDHNLHSNPHDDSSERSKSDSAPLSAAGNVEYSLVDADNDIFSHSIHSNDTIEQIDIVFPSEEPPPSSMAKTSSTVDSATVLDTKQSLAVTGQDDLNWPDIGTTLLGDNDGLGGSWVDDVLRQYDRESSRERESLSETALSNGFDYRLETMSSSSFFSEDDDRVGVNKRSSSPEKRISDKNNGYSPEMSRESPDYSDSVFSPELKRSSPGKFDLSLESGKISPDKPFLTPNSTRSSVAKKDSTANSRRSSADHIRFSEPNSRRSSVDKNASTTNSRRSSVDKKILTPSSRRSSVDKKISTPSSTRSSTPDSTRSTPDRRGSTPDSKRSTPDIRSYTPDVIPEETTADLPDDEAAVSMDNDQLGEEETFHDPVQEQEIGESDEAQLRRKESEAVDRLLADLEITEEEIQRAYNTPTIKIETGVEEGALTLRGHKNDEIEPDAEQRSGAESPITEADRSESHSVFGFEDSDEERRRKWRERPFPKRAARSFFARLCACWHH